MSGAALTEAPAGCFVEASAGTGKTTRLVQEIAAAIAVGVPMERIAAVTFTHAAAGSMKIRVRQELERRSMHPEADAGERERLRAGLQHLDRAFIGTIHSFCAYLLRLRPVEAHVDPDFRELSQPEALTVFGQVFRSWIEQRLSVPSPILKRTLARLGWQEEPLSSLQCAAWNLAEWRDYDAPWVRREFHRKEAIGRLLDQTSEVVRGLQPVADLVDRVRRAREADVFNLDEAEADLLNLKQNVGKYPRIRGSVLAGWKALLASIDEFRISADADLASELRDELWPVVEEYQKTKQRAGQLDFSDLLISAHELLRNEHARRDLQCRYDRILIDEFQDTDPLQAEILLLLCGSDFSNLFVVGDPKQSIYRFRRADARQYERIREYLHASGVPSQKLATSYRSVDMLQSFVNSAFTEKIPDYLALTGGIPTPANQPCVVALPIPRVYSGPWLSRKTVAAEAPVTVAAFIDWLVRDSGWTVRDPVTQAQTKICPEHICVLFRRFTSYGVDLTQEYVRRLESREIPHVLVGSRSFHQREETGTVRTALRAIEWPNDELSVFAVLRGALFFIPDSTLLKFRDKYRRFSPWIDLGGETDPEFDRVKDVFFLLRELHSERNARPPAETIRALLEHARAHVGFAFHSGGERRLANIYRLCDLARSFELSGPSSFRAFVEYLEREHDSGEQSEAPVLEQQAGGVQIMTVHKAKGLEFPIVILADTTTNRTRKEGPERYVNHDRRLCAQRLCGWAPWDLVEHSEEERAEDENEAVRLAYVAATRARDLLVVTAVGEPGWEGNWLDPLESALFPPRDAWRSGVQTPAMPSRGHATVLDRPPEMGMDEPSIRPGLHRPRCGDHEVLWFDPALLDRSARSTQSLDHEELLRGSPEQQAAGVARYRDWHGMREATLRSGSVPTFQIRRVTDVKSAEETSSIPLEVIRLSQRSTRPAGRIFGRIVHAILQARRSSEIDRLAALHGRRWNASEAEVTAAAETARAALRHPLVAAEGALEVCQELPVSVTLDDGEIAEGLVDLAWSDGKTWTVVDYKTGPGGKRHESQVKLYGLALQRATGLPARAVLLEI